MKNLKKTIFALFTFFSVSTVVAQSASSKTDLLFVIEFDSYTDWYQKAFKKDTERRSEFCDETETKVGKISDNSSFVLLRDFDLSKMKQFASDKKMEKFIKKFNVKHNEVNKLTKISEVSSMPAKSDLFFIVKSIDVDSWYQEAFSVDSKRRADFCNESKTKVSKLDPKTALVTLYDFDLTKMKEFESNDKMVKLMKKFKVSHDVYLMNKL